MQKCNQPQLLATLAAALLVLTTLAYGSPQAVPPNDSAAGAELIPADGPFPYPAPPVADISEATTAGDPPLPSDNSSGLPLSRSLWYRFTPAVSAIYTLSTCQDAPTATTVDDTIMGVYTSTGGSGGPFGELPTQGLYDGADDNSCGFEPGQAQVVTRLDAGTSYYIVIWQVGDFAPPVGNTGVQLRVSRSAAPLNDTCAVAEALPLDMLVSGATTGANNDYQLPMGSGAFGGIGHTPSTAPGKEVVYSFSAPTAGSYSFRVTNYLQNNPVLYVAGDCASGTPPMTLAALGAANRTSSGSAEEVLGVALSAGQMVYVFVDEHAQSAGTSFMIEANRTNAEGANNNTPQQAGALACFSTGAITPADDADFYSLGAPAAGARVFALADGVAANADNFDLRVTTDTNTLEYDDANNDAGFGQSAPNVAGTPLDGAAAYLRVNYTGDATQAEPYRLLAVVQPPPTNASAESEPNDTIVQANGAAGNYFMGALADSADDDLFAFSANAGELLFLSLDGDPLRNQTPANLSLALLDSSGGALVEVSDASAASALASPPRSLSSITPFSPGEGLTYRATVTGTYYARVTGAAAGDYLLSIARNCTAGGGGLPPTPTATLTATATPTPTVTGTPPTATSSPTATETPSATVTGTPPTATSTAVAPSTPTATTEGGATGLRLKLPLVAK
jgi:hypothetical protein